jgi:hypothetical protein
MRQTDEIPRTEIVKKKLDPNPYDVCDPNKAINCKKTRCRALTKVDRDCYQTSNPL